jgi:uncharacterized membrane protein
MPKRFLAAWGAGEGTAPSPPDLWDAAGHVAQRQEGYVQAVDHDGLLTCAERHDAVFRLDVRAGDVVVADDRRIRVHPAGPADE